MSTPKYLGLVGCYTKPGQADPFEELGGVPHDRTKVGNGLLAIAVDEDGRLSFLNEGAPIVTAEEVPNPSYLCILEKCGGSGRPEALRGGGVCVVSELDEGKLHAFALSCEQASGEMKISAKAVGSAVDTGGSYPCHVISCNVGNAECVVVCNYGEEEGVLSLFGTSNGTDGYARKVRIPFGAGSKVDMDRQEASHAHSTSTITPLTSASKMDLCCADLGSDAIVQFALNADTGPDGEVSLQCVEKERLAAPPGSGPRSLTFNPVHSNVAIVSLEMTAQVWLMRRLDDGRFVGLGDPVSVLPEGWPDQSSANEAKFNQGRWASDAVWSPGWKVCVRRGEAAQLDICVRVGNVRVRSDRGSEVGAASIIGRNHAPLPVHVRVWAVHLDCPPAFARHILLSKEWKRWNTGLCESVRGAQCGVRKVGPSGANRVALS